MAEEISKNLSHFTNIIELNIDLSVVDPESKS